MKFEYHTEGTCSRNIILEMDGDTIQSCLLYTSDAADE